MWKISLNKSKKRNRFQIQKVKKDSFVFIKDMMKLKQMGILKGIKLVNL